MKYILILILLASCNVESYDDVVRKQFNELKSPVVIIGIWKNNFIGDELYSISVKDSSGKVLEIGNQSIFARTIGASRNIGDTIK